MSFVNSMYGDEKANKLSLLQGAFIIATPLVSDPLFAKQVVFISESDDDTTYGFFVGFNLQSTDIIDGAVKMLAGTIFEDDELYLGGPVATETLFLLHSQEVSAKSTYRINDFVSVTPLDKALKHFSVKPASSMILSGYCEWHTGQLEREFKSGYWFSKEFNHDFLFKVYANKWGKCLKDHRINPMMFDFNIGLS